MSFGVAVAIGNSIGAGIMRTPGENAARLPDAALILSAWMIGAVYSLLGAWSLSELGAMVPSSGGYYKIAKRAFGDYAGFVVGWTDWVGQCGSIAAVALLIGEYAGNLLPRLMPHALITAGTVLVLIALVQGRGIRWGSWFQNATSSITALVFFSLIGLAFVVGHPVAVDGVVPRRPPSGVPLVVAYVLVLQSVIYTFEGWNGPVYFGGEFRNPGREMPRSLVNGVLLLSAIYLLINGALIHVLGIAMLSNENLAVSKLAKIMLGPHGEGSVRLLVLIALASLANAGMLCGSRILYSMSSDGWAHRRISTVNRGGAPAMALLLTATAALLFMFSGSFEQVLAVTAFLFVAKYTVSYIGVFALRKREPDTPRPYHAWGHPWTTGAAVIGSLAFLVGVALGDPRNSLYSCLVLMASYPVYLGIKKP